MLWGIIREFVGFILQSLELRSNFNIAKLVDLFFLTLFHILVLNLSQMCNPQRVNHPDDVIAVFQKYLWCFEILPKSDALRFFVIISMHSEN